METLYRENVKIISHYLYSLCGEEELVKDLTQETFLRAYESLERFDGSCKISTWLCQIAKHLLYQHWAKAGRKVLRKNLRQSVLNLGLCLLTAFLMLLVFKLAGAKIPYTALYIIFPICLLMTWLTFRNQKKLRTWDKWDSVMTVMAVLATGYGAGMMRHGFSRAVNGETIFGLALNEFGPFLYGQMVLAAILCFCVYVLQIVRTVKQGRSNSLPLGLSMTGIFLMMAYCIYMGYLTDLQSAEKILNEETFTVLLVGLNCTFVFAMMDKMVKR